MKRLGQCFFVGAIICICLFIIPYFGHTNTKNQQNIHPTTEIHPSVILDGNVTIGAYTRIDAGTVPDHPLPAGSP